MGMPLGEHYQELRVKQYRQQSQMDGFLQDDYTIFTMTSDGSWLEIEDIRWLQLKKNLPLVISAQIVLHLPSSHDLDPERITLSDTDMLYLLL